MEKSIIFGAYLSDKTSYKISIICKSNCTEAKITQNTKFSADFCTSGLIFRPIRTAKVQKYARELLQLVYLSTFLIVNGL